MSEFLEKAKLPEEEKKTGMKLIEMIKQKESTTYAVTYTAFSTIDQQELVNMLRSFLEVEIFPYGWMISDLGYQARDVSPAFTLVVPMAQSRYPGLDINKAADQL